MEYCQVRYVLPYGAKIKLEKKSGIILSFPSGEPYQMKTPENLYPYSETIIMLPLKQKGDNQLKLLGSQLYNSMKKMIKDGSMDVEMSQAVAGIKGTIFIPEENGNTFSLKVLEGEVDLPAKTIIKKS